MATQSEMSHVGNEPDAPARIDELLKSLDGVTSPISLARGPVAGTFEVVMVMTSKGVELIDDLAMEAGADWETILSRALVLYKKALEAVREGKAVGIADDPNSLDVRFTKL